MDNFLIMKGTLKRKIWNWRRSTKANVTLYQSRIYSYIPIVTAKTKLKIISLDTKADFIFIVITYKTIQSNVL